MLWDRQSFQTWARALFTQTVPLPFLETPDPWPKPLATQAQDASVNRVVGGAAHTQGGESFPQEQAKGQGPGRGRGQERQGPGRGLLSHPEGRWRSPAQPRGPACPQGSSVLSGPAMARSTAPSWDTCYVRPSPPGTFLLPSPACLQPTSTQGWWSDSNYYHHHTVPMAPRLTRCPVHTPISPSSGLTGLWAFSLPSRVPLPPPPIATLSARAPTRTCSSRKPAPSLHSCTHLHEAGRAGPGQHLAGAPGQQARVLLRRAHQGTVRIGWDGKACA